MPDFARDRLDEILDWLDTWLGEPEARIAVASLAVVVNFALLWWLA
jgi:hypothetical protein